MKKKVIVIVSVILILFIIGYGSIIYTDYRKVEKGEVPVFAKYSAEGTYQGLGYTVEVTYYPETDIIEEMNMKLFGKTIAGMVQSIEEQAENQNIVIIENGNIHNEDKIDEFIRNRLEQETSSLQIITIENGKETHITVEFIQGQYQDENALEEDNTDVINTVNMQVPSENAISDYARVIDGYYRVTENGKEIGIYDHFDWEMRKITKDNVVQIVMKSNLIDVAENPVICEYSLESSEHQKKFELTYMGRKDMGVKKIAEKNQFDNLDFGVYTIAGDVSITIEEDMVYSLEDALSQGIISVQDILDQAIEDEKYGICERAYSQDGGSTEYRYADYTILKYSTLNGNKDLVIGMQGTILNQVNASGYKTEEEKNIEYKLSKIFMFIPSRTVTNTGATVSITDKNDVPYTYGEWYRIDKKENGRWRELEPIQEIDFSDIGWEVGEDGKIEKEFNWSNLYGELESGNYRLIKRVYDNGYYYLDAEFSID